MKKKIISLITAGVMVAPILGVIACGGNEAKWTETYQPPAFGGTKLEDKKLVSVVSDPENPRWQKAKTQIEAAGNDLFGQTKTNIKKDQNEQNDWLNANKGDGDGYLIGASDDSVGTFIKAVENKPVVAYDRLINVEADNYNWYVTFDNSKVGFLQGASILENLYGGESFITKTQEQILDFVEGNKLAEEKGIISVAGSPTDNNAKLFFDGAGNLIKEAMAKDPNLQWYGSDDFSENAQDDWDYSTGQEWLKTTINDNDANKNKIAAVLSPNDGMAEAAIAALKSSGLDPEKIYITGQDSNDTALDNITNKEKQNMTIFKPDAQAARIGVAIVANLVDGNPANDDKAGMDAYLKAAYSGIQFSIQFGAESTYKANDTKPINTVLLDPTVIDTDNLSEFFKKSE